MDAKRCFVGWLYVWLVGMLALLSLSGCVTSRNPASGYNDGKISLAEATRWMEEEYAPGKLWKMRRGVRKYAKDPEKAWEWFVKHRQNRKGMVPAAYRDQSMAHSKRFCLPPRRAAVNPWTYVGPVQFGAVQPSGRIVDLAVHPNGQTIYAATASGGVWKSVDQGQNWTNCTDRYLPSLGCGSIAMDPNNPDIVYVGLGEGMTGSGEGVEPLGTGIYKTTDAGATWSLVPGTGNGTMQFIVDIRFQGNSSTLLVAATGGYGGAGSGLWKTTNGGGSWTPIVEGIAIWSVSVDPTDANKVVISTREYDDTNGNYARIFYATDGVQSGSSFSEASLPSYQSYDDDIGASERIEMTRCASAPNTMYALVASTKSKIHGTWKSTNGGSQWVATSLTGIAPKGDENWPGQLTYNNCIAVDPQNANRVYFGSNVRSYRTTDGANSWAAMTDWVQDNPALPYIHADHHVIAFAPNNNNTVMFGTDGGFFISFDGGNSWVERNHGIHCTQIYRCSNHPQNQSALIFGCQDNDKYLRKPDGNWYHYPNTFGDGMEMECYPLDPESDAYLGQGYNGSNIQMTPDGGQNWYWLRDYEAYNNGIPDNELGAWVAPLMLDPQHPENIWVCLENVYRQPYDEINVQQWTRVLQLPPTPYVDMWEYMDLSHGTTNRQLYVGFARYNTQNQFTVGLYRADIGDGTAVSATNFVELTLPRQGYLGAIKCDPTDNDSLWISYTDFFFEPAFNGRIYKSENMGQTWVEKTNNFPRDLPVTAIFIDPQNAQTIILGTDLGCYRSDDGGASWYEYNNSSLPYTVVTDFAYFHPERLLRAASYGRGLWEINLDGSVGEPDIVVTPTHLTFSKDSALQKQVGALPVASAAEVQSSRVPELQAAMPEGLRSTAEVTILNETFETGPYDNWTTWHDEGLDVDWDIDSTYRSHTGSKSIWCAASAYDPATDWCPDMISPMIAYGPFDLSDAVAGQMTCYAWWQLLTANEDYLGVYVSLDEDLEQVGGIQINDIAYSDGWLPITIDFADVPGLGNVLGRSQVWIVFHVFRDFDWIGYRVEGAWIDDVLITKSTVGSLDPPTGVSATTDLSDRVTVTWNAPAGATEYQVWRHAGSDNPAAATALSGWLAAQAYDDSTAEIGTTYYYYVMARNLTQISLLSAGAAGMMSSGSTLAPQTFTVSNPGNGTLSITGIAKQQGSDWLVCTPNAFPITIAAGNSQVFTVRVLDIGMAAGVYNDQLEISNNTETKNPYADAVFVTFNNDASCDYTLSPASANFSAAAGSGSFEVTAGSGCVWTATESVSWLTISSGSSGSGSGRVSYDVSANSTSSSRNAVITVAGQSHAVTQAGASGEQAVVMSITPVSSSVSIGDEFDLTIGLGCNGQPVNLASAFIDFDAAVLEVVSVTPGTTLTVPLQNSYDNQAGTIDFKAGTFLTPYPDGDFNLAVVRLKAKNEAIASPLVFHSEGLRVTDAANGSASVLGRADGATVTVEDAAGATVFVCGTYACDCGGNQPCYGSIGLAMAGLTGNGVVKIGTGYYLDDLVLSGAGAITFSGGWNSGFVSKTDRSTIGGSLTIGSGSKLTVEGLTLIKP